MVDVLTAEHHGVCPVCEGYGGRPDDDDCQREDSTCLGSCPKCWCPGCHDGAVLTPEVAARDPEERMGSWAAYKAVQELGVAPDQLTIAAALDEEGQR